MKENIRKLLIFFLWNQMQSVIVHYIAKDSTHRYSEILVFFLKFFKTKNKAF